VGRLSPFEINWDNFLYSNLLYAAEDAYINPKLFED
jgi:hypothetical protein